MTVDLESARSSARRPQDRMRGGRTTVGAEAAQSSAIVGTETTRASARRPHGRRHGGLTIVPATL